MPGAKMAITALETMTENAGQEFSDFYAEWFARVYNYARHRTGSAVRADEIASDTFLRALGSWKSFDPLKGDRRTWLFSIAFRAVADHYRSETRRRWLTLGFAPEPVEPPPFQGLEADEESRRLADALKTLGDQQREIVSLKFYGGMTNRAIALLLRLTEANVGVILFRSVRRLRETLPGGESGHG